MLLLKLASKFTFSKSKGQRVSSVFIILGLAAGLAALIVISYVMNGLQNSQILQLRNIESFDLIVDSSVPYEELSAMEEIDAVYAFSESYGILYDGEGETGISVRYRAIDTDYFSDERLVKDFYITDSFLDTGIAVSPQLLNKLDISYTSDIKSVFIKSGKTATLVPYSEIKHIEALFNSSLPDFNSMNVFIDLDAFLDINPNAQIRYGIFSKTDSSVLAEKIRNLYPDSRIITWKEYNKVIYTALVLEKTLVYVFIAFVFLVVCIGLKNSTNRLIRYRKTEISSLRAMGLSNGKCLSVFLIQGALVTCSGELFGIITGLIVSANLNKMDIFKQSFLGSSFMSNAGISAGELLISSAGIFLLAMLFTLTGCRKLLHHDITEVIKDASN